LLLPRNSHESAQNIRVPFGQLKMRKILFFVAVLVGFCAANLAGVVVLAPFVLSEATLIGAVQPLHVITAHLMSQTSIPALVLLYMAWQLRWVHIRHYVLFGTLFAFAERTNFLLWLIFGGPDPAVTIEFATRLVKSVVGFTLAGAVGSAVFWLFLWPFLPWRIEHTRPEPVGT
jgi:hypothetical protein